MRKGYTGLSSLCLAAAIVILLAPPAKCQTIAVVKHLDSLHRIVEMEGGKIVADVGGELTALSSGPVGLRPAASYTDGMIRVISKDARMLQSFGVSYGQFFFRLDAEIEAERDFDRCFIFLLVKPEEGEATYRLHEIGNIDAGRQKLNLSIPANAGFGGGQFSYHLFSRGEEIQIIDPQASAKIAKAAAEASENAKVEGKDPPRDSRPAATGPSLAIARSLKQPLPDYPAALKGTGLSGLAKLTFTIGKDGEVIEILDLAADAAAFLPEARKAILRAPYQPTVLDGVALETTVSQIITFSEDVCFAEALEVIMSPSFSDREPTLVYGPPLEFDRARHGKKGKGSVKVAFTVDVLGRATDASIAKAPNDIVAQDFLELLSSWVFLPQLSDGQAHARRMSYAVEVK